MEEKKFDFYFPQTSVVDNEIDSKGLKRMISDRYILLLKISIVSVKCKQSN